MLKKLGGFLFIQVPTEPLAWVSTSSWWKHVGGQCIDIGSEVKSFIVLVNCLTMGKLLNSGKISFFANLKIGRLCMLLISSCLLSSMDASGYTYVLLLLGFLNVFY